MARIADRMKELREENGLTGLEMAKKLGVNKSTVTRYETGEITPSIDMLIKIRETFGVTIDWLTGVDTEGEDKYIPAVKKSIESGISPEALTDMVNAMARARKE